MTHTKQAPPTPEKVMQYFFAHVPTQAMCSAIELSLFTHIKRGKGTVQELQLATGASERGLFLLTNALCAMGLLEKDGETLLLAPDAEMFLVEDSRAYLGSLSTQVRQSWGVWNRLTDAVRTGTAADGGLEEERDDFFSTWVDGLFNLNFPAAQAAAEHLHKGAERILDVAAGSGVWGLAFALKNPRAEVLAVDLPSVTEKVTRPFAERMGVADRYSFLKHDLHTAEFGREDFDVATLGHILHSEGDQPSQELLCKVHAALKPGGKVVIAEMIPDEERSRDMLGNLFGLNMLVHTAGGTVYTRSDLERMTREAGFGEVEWLEVPAPFPLLIGHK